MSASEPPPEFVPLWPVSRGPLQAGHIVRLAGGNLAEWYPLPEGWTLPGPKEASETDAPGPDDAGRVVANPRDILEFAGPSDSSPGWLLLPRSDDPTLDKLLAGAVHPNQRARVLKGFAAFIRSRIDKKPIVLHPALIFAPGADLVDSDVIGLETWDHPSPKDMGEVWADFFSSDLTAGQDAGTQAEDGGRFLQLSDLLIRKNDPEGAASFLEAWASNLLRSEKKRLKETRIFWVLAVSVIVLILGWALTGRFAREQFEERIHAQKQIKQAEALRGEQIKSLALWGRRMREALPNSGLVSSLSGRFAPQLSPDERKQWQDWLALASTFESQDNSEPEILLIRAGAHHLLGQNDEARQLWRRVASGTGPRAALGCLALAHMSAATGDQLSVKDRKGWLDQADNVLDADDDSPFTDLVRAQIGFSQERFCLENNAIPEAEKLRIESVDLAWDLVENRTRERHGELAPQAVILLLENLDARDRKLAKVGNLLEETIARNPGFFDLYRVKNDRLAEIRRDGVSRSEKIALGLAQFQAVALMAARFPHRLERRSEEILACLDLVDESTLFGGAMPAQNGAEEIWIWAMEQTQSLLNKTPREANYLRLSGRGWITGARVAGQIPGGDGISLDRLDKGLRVWNLLERLQGPREEIRLARARTLAEMAGVALRMGNAKLFGEFDTACQTILATLLQENPGAIVALETQVRSRWIQALFELSQKENKKAKPIIEGLAERIQSFPPSRDAEDQKQVRLLLIQAKLLELNWAIRNATGKDREKRLKELTAIRDSAGKIPVDSDTRDELARIQARLALLEWSLGPASPAKTEGSKSEAKTPGNTRESLEKIAEEKSSQAVWEPWEGRHLHSIWKPAA